MFRQHLRELRWTTIECGAASPGVPDSHYIARGGVEGWVEFKQTDANKISSLTAEQVTWLETHERHGGRAWIACRRRHGGGPRLGDSVDELWMVSGGLARVVLRGGLAALPSESRGESWRRWAGGREPWDWPAVRGVLTAGRP